MEIAVNTSESAEQDDEQERARRHLTQQYEKHRCSASAEEEKSTCVDSIRGEAGGDRSHEVPDRPRRRNEFEDAIQ